MPLRTTLAAMSNGTRAWLRRAVTLVGAGVVALLLLLLVATARDDRAISTHEGTAIADVLSTGPRSAAVSFTTPDGVTHVPPTGVLFPTGLAVGTRIDVEYSTLDPDLVRVAGRGWVLALLPVGTVLLVTGVLVLGLRRLLRRRVPRVPAADLAGPVLPPVEDERAPSA